MRFGFWAAAILLLSPLAARAQVRDIQDGPDKFHISIPAIKGWSVMQDFGNDNIVKYVLKAPTTTLVALRVSVVPLSGKGLAAQFKARAQLFLKQRKEMMPAAKQSQGGYSSKMVAQKPQVLDVGYYIHSTGAVGTATEVTRILAVVLPGSKKVVVLEGTESIPQKVTTSKILSGLFKGARVTKG